MSAYREWLRDEAAVRLAGVVETLHRRGVRADHVSLIGGAVAILSIPALLTGWPHLAGLLFLSGTFLDFLDGALARRSGPTPFGSLLDSSVDRLVDGAVLFTVGVHLALTGRPGFSAVAGAALIASFLTSYVRARAEGLGVACAEGAFTRLERVLVLGLGLLFDLLGLAVVVIAVLGALTTVQRLLIVRRSLAGSR